MNYRRLIVLILFATAGVSGIHLSRMSSRMVVCDVGQGDGIVITSGSVQMLVDGGPNGSSILSCLGKYLPFWDRKVEIVVMTNSDKDHIGGLAEVMRHYEVEVLLTSDGIKGTASFMELSETIRKMGVEVEVVEMGDIINMGDEIRANVIWPDQVEDEVVQRLFAYEIEVDQVLGEWDGEEINERSVGMLVEVDGTRILMMADLGEESEVKLIEGGYIDDVHILKVGHHGSKFSTSERFIEQVKPEIAVISVGKNSYGHPTDEVLNRLGGAGVRILRTDTDGDVVIEL